MTTPKIILTGAVLAAVALPGSAVASEPAATPSASEQCKTLRTQMGAKPFGEAYGTNANRANAFGKCVSKLASAHSAAKTNAAQDCKAERAKDAAAFTAKYGTGKKGANAYGKCVSAKTKAAVTEAKAVQLTAAKACKAERAKDAAAFAKKYGTNANKSNAFGKCVSAKAMAKPAAPAAPAAA